jgi:rubrerythrin
MSRSAENAKVQDLFKSLASMKLTHLATFEKMRDDIEDIDVVVAGDTGEYIAALVENNVFNDDLTTSEMVLQADSDEKVFQLARQAEKDSILLYYELRDILPDSVSFLIDSILGEEKRHVRQLNAVLKDITDTR